MHRTNLRTETETETETETAGAGAGAGAGAERCRACLSAGRRLAALDARAAPLYAALCDSRSDEVLDAVLVCWECCAVLQKTLQFQLRARRARDWLEWARWQKGTENQPNIKSLSTLQSSVKTIFDKVICSETIPPLDECDETRRIRTELMIGAAVDHFVSLTTPEGNKEANERSLKANTWSEFCDIKSEDIDEEIFQKSGIFNEPNSSVKRTSNKEQRTAKVINELVFVDYPELYENKVERKNIVKLELQKITHPHSKKKRRSSRQSHQCKHCSKVFKKRTALSSHYKDEHYIYQCDYCGRKFSCYLRIKRHLLCYTQGTCVKNKRINNLPRPAHECDDCGAIFTYRCNLIDHMRTHTGEKPYECSECSKKYTQIASLNRHLRTHRDDKRYKCSFCGQCFLERRSLTDHCNTHTGVKPYLCSKCGKTFTQRAALRTHAKIHTGIKPFECSNCGKMFRTRGSYNVHCKSHCHPDKFCNITDEL